MTVLVADNDTIDVEGAGQAGDEHLADRSLFEAMPEGALFINTTRASVVDEDALA